MELNSWVRIFGNYSRLDFSFSNFKIFKIWFFFSFFLGKDISNVVNNKTGALVFMDAARTVSSGLGQAGTFINGITLEGLENGTTFANRMFFNLFEVSRI